MFPVLGGGKRLLRIWQAGKARQDRRVSCPLWPAVTRRPLFIGCCRSGSIQPQRPCPIMYLRSLKSLANPGKFGAEWVLVLPLCSHPKTSHSIPSRVEGQMGLRRHRTGKWLLPAPISPQTVQRRGASLLTPLASIELMPSPATRVHPGEGNEGSRKMQLSFRRTRNATDCATEQGGISFPVKPVCLSL